MTHRENTRWVTGHCLGADREISIYYAVQREHEAEAVLQTGQWDGGNGRTVSYMIPQAADQCRLVPNGAPIHSQSASSTTRGTSVL